ncbi:MAG: DinB family protein [Chitinophagaceae bacterium]
MERQTIIQLLKEKHSAFIAFINGLTDEEFLFAYQQKWTAGQQLDHIYLSVKPVALALSLPKSLIRLLFGKANRSGRTYEELVKKYLIKLENGAKSTRQFIPKNVRLNQKETISKALKKKVDILCSKIEKFTEQELDTLILPHPLLGKLTVREMLYFTIYHVGHHHEATKRNLEASS